MSHEHHFTAHLVWTGAARGTTSSYAAYSREYRVDIEGKPSIAGSAAPPFRGDGALHNPEDMLMAALSACHCLSYLALCARQGVHVASYEDRATGKMERKDGKIRFTEVVLRPVVEIVGGDETRALALHHDAHEECFIASSVNFDVRNEPVVKRRA